MGEVWVARQHGELGFERRVALKTLHPRLADEPDALAMLMDEARIMSRIVHENVVQTLDVGREGDVFFIVMELVLGETLAKIHGAHKKRGETVPLAAALSIVSDVLAGLQAAHELTDEHGEPLHVVHRDVSLENILVSSAGRAKLIDFGVAKARGRIASETQGVAKGKVRYMAPEQAKGKGVDRRADIWAVGAVLRILVTGKAPYAGETDIETLYMIANGQAPSPLPQEIAGKLRDVLEGALAPSPSARFATAAQMRAVVDEARAELSGTAGDVARLVVSAVPEIATEDTSVVPTREMPTQPFARDTTLALAVSSTPSLAAASEPARAKLPQAAILGAIIAAILIAGLAVARGVSENRTTTTADPAPLPSGMRAASMPSVEIAPSANGAADGPASSPLASADTRKGTAATPPKGGPSRPAKPGRPAAGAPSGRDYGF